MASKWAANESRAITKVDRHGQLASRHKEPPRISGHFYEKDSYNRERSCSPGSEDNKAVRGPRDDAKKKGKELQLPDNGRLQGQEWEEITDNDLDFQPIPISKTRPQPESAHSTAMVVGNKQSKGQHQVAMPQPRARSRDSSISSRTSRSTSRSPSRRRHHSPSQGSRRRNRDRRHGEDVPHSRWSIDGHDRHRQRNHHTETTARSDTRSTALTRRPSEYRVRHSRDTLKTSDLSSLLQHIGISENESDHPLHRDGRNSKRDHGHRDNRNDKRSSPRSRHAHKSRRVSRSPSPFGKYTESKRGHRDGYDSDSYYSRRRGSRSRSPSDSQGGKGGSGRSRRDEQRPKASSSSSPLDLGAAAKNALRAGAMAVLLNHNVPGAWMGAKGKQVATAALGAALVDTYVSHKYPERLNGLRHTAIRQVAEYAIGSIVTEPIMNQMTKHQGRR